MAQWSKLFCFLALLIQPRLAHGQPSAVPAAMNGFGAASNGLPRLTNIQQIIQLGNLGVGQTQYWARVRGVVTFLIPRTHWIFIHEEAAGMVVTFADQGFRPEVGQLIEAEGRVQPGGFTPYIRQGQGRVVGRADLPRPKKADLAKLFAGEDYARYVVVRGHVRDLGLGGGFLSMLISNHRYRFRAQAIANNGEGFPRDWLDAEVEVTGVCQTGVLSDGYPFGFTIYGTSTNMVKLLAPGWPSNLFDRPLQMIKQLSNRAGPNEARVKVQGVVTLRQPTGNVFLQDSSGALEMVPMIVLSGLDIQDQRIDHPSGTPLTPGDLVEAVGTPVHLPRGLVLGHAEYRKLSSGPEIPPVTVKAVELKQGLHYSQLVTLRGWLVDRETRPGPSGFETQSLVLESGGQNLGAMWMVNGSGELPMKTNSYVEVTGVASATMGELGRRRSFCLWLRGPGDVKPLAPPAFWQRSEALRALGVAIAIGLLGLAAIVFLRRRVHQRTAQLTETNRQLRHEIAERTRAEERVAQALDAERELGRLKSNFVSMVSHEFRTPLGNIQSSAELLADYTDRLPPDRRERLLRSIVDSAHNMALIMEEVLLLSRVEAANYECQPECFNLADLCQRLVDELQSASDGRCPIQLILGALPERVWADPTLLRHVFTNLLSNAVKYSRPGELVEFIVQRENHEAVFVIRDRGIGVASGDLDRLFNAFFRGTNTAGIPGTGLGLVIVKRCVDLHNGQIDLKSQPGAGTTVTVKLPLFAKEFETSFLRRHECLDQAASAQKS